MLMEKKDLNTAPFCPRTDTYIIHVFANFIYYLRAVIQLRNDNNNSVR